MSHHLRFVLFGACLAACANAAQTSGGENNPAGGGTDDGGSSADGAPGSGDGGVLVGDLSQKAYLKPSNTETTTSGLGAFYFGQATAVSGDGATVAVGAPGESSKANGIDGDQTPNMLTEAGAVYVFRKTNGHFAQEAYVKASNNRSDDTYHTHFGAAVQLSADGNLLVVGAPNEGNYSLGVNGDQAGILCANSVCQDVPGSGAVYVFRRTGSQWAQTSYLKASNTFNGNHFGASLALSSDGKTLVVGSPAEGSAALGVNGDQNLGHNENGAAYVFVQSGSSWTQQAYVKASVARTHAPGSEFGRSLALSADGASLAVASWGALDLYQRSGATWSVAGAVENAAEQFGSAVAMSGDGSNVVVGASGVTCDDGSLQCGVLFAYGHQGAAWSLEQTLKSPGPKRDFFGSALAMSADGSRLAVSGANQEIGNDADRGVLLFGRSGNAWVEAGALHAGTEDKPNGFGTGLGFAADGSSLVIGARFEQSNAKGVDGDPNNHDGAGSGAAYVFAR